MAPGVPMLLQGQEFMQEGAFNDWKMLEWDKTEQFAGIVLAHKHLIDLRRNRHNNTKGLMGQFVQLVHRDDDNNVLAFHRKDAGGSGDDTIAIFNFGKNNLKKYILPLPIAGEWVVRFNSCWKGYSVDFHETHFNGATTADNGSVGIALAPYSFVVMSQDTHNS